MKHQQVVPDYASMVQTSGTVLCLVFSGWVLFRLVQAVFWLPGYLEKTGGSLYEKMELKKDRNLQKSVQKDKDADADDENCNEDNALIEEEQDGEVECSKESEPDVPEEVGNEEQQPTGSKKDN